MLECEKRICSAFDPLQNWITQRVVCSSLIICCRWRNKRDLYSPFKYHFKIMICTLICKRPVCLESAAWGASCSGCCSSDSSQPWLPHSNCRLVHTNLYKYPRIYLAPLGGEKPSESLGRLALVDGDTDQSTNGQVGIVGSQVGVPGHQLISRDAVFDSISLI
jgi:hypothetical protein